MKTLPNTITRWDELESNFPNYTEIFPLWSKFINFIKLELEPWMFIPWDMGKNCPLEEPDKDNMAFYTHKNISIQEEYQQAKDRVIFKGFVIIKNIHGFRITLPSLLIYESSRGFVAVKSIQDLCDKVQLTPTGEKQAGL